MMNPFTRVPPVFPDAFEVEQVPVHFRDAFRGASMSEQVHITCEELRGPDNMRVPLEVIAGFLGLSRQSLFNHLHRPIETKAIGRLKCLPP
jgi:hypothetical protein